MFGQGQLAAGRTQAVDHLDGHNLGWASGLFALGNMAFHDLVEPEIPPQPKPQPDGAKRTGVGPPHGVQADAHDVGIIRQADVIVVGKETELTTVSLPVVKQDGALPAALLVVAEFAEMGDDSLPWPRVGPDAFDQGVVGGRLAVSGAVVASQEHGSLPTRT